MNKENEVVKNDVILNCGITARRAPQCFCARSQDLQRLSLPLYLRNNMRGRSRIKYGMTSLFNKAFTLIELLVVVLIIGILAAVAVPQYQRAVAKARFTEALVNLKTLSQADQVCRQATGQTYCDITELDIELAGEEGDYLNRPAIVGKNFTYVGSNNPGGSSQVIAVHNEEDVCICMQDDGAVWVQQDDQCREQPAKYEYSSLLNIPQGICFCC